MATITHKQLGQTRPASTTAASVYSPAASTQAIIKTIVIAETLGGAAAYSVFFDDDGTTYDETTAIAFGVAIAANTTVTLSGFYAMNDSTGNLAVKTDTNDALTFTVFGAEIT